MSCKDLITNYDALCSLRGRVIVGSHFLIEVNEHQPVKTGWRDGKKVRIYAGVGIFESSLNCGVILSPQILSFTSGLPPGLQSHPAGDQSGPGSCGQAPGRHGG